MESEDYPFVTGADFPQEMVDAVLDACPHLARLDLGQKLVRATLGSMSLDPQVKQRVLSDANPTRFKVEALVDALADEARRFNFRPLTGYLGLNGLALVESASVVRELRGESGTVSDDIRVARSIADGVERASFRSALDGVDPAFWDSQACGCFHHIFGEHTQIDERSLVEHADWQSAGLLVDQVRWRDAVGLLEGGNASALHAALSTTRIPSRLPGAAMADWPRAWRWVSKRILESGDRADSLSKLEFALGAFGDAIEVRGLLELRSERTSTRVDLANALAIKNELSRAIELYAQALDEYNLLIEREGLLDLRIERVNTKGNLALALSSQGQLDRAVELYTQALAEYEHLIQREGRSELRVERARTNGNLAGIFKSQGRIDLAVDVFDEALAEYEDLIEHEGLIHLSGARASARANLAAALKSQGQVDRAIDLYAKALQEYEDLIERLGRSEFRHERAHTLSNLASALDSQGRLDRALEVFSKALNEYDSLIGREGRSELRHHRARIRGNLAITLGSRGEFDRAVELFTKALDEYTLLVEGEGRSELRDDRAGTQVNLAYTQYLRNELYVSVEHYSQALNEYEDLIERQGRSDLRDRRSRALTSLANVLQSQGQLNRAIELNTQALDEYRRIVEVESRSDLRARQAIAAGTLAGLWQTLDNHRLAVELYIQALAELDYLLELDLRADLRTAHAVFKGNLAGLLAANGDVSRAVELYKSEPNWQSAQPHVARLGPENLSHLLPTSSELMTMVFDLEGFCSPDRTQPPATDSKLRFLLQRAAVPSTTLPTVWHTLDAMEHLLPTLGSVIDRALESKRALFIELMREVTALQLRWLADVLSNAEPAFLTANTERIERMVELARLAVLRWNDPLDLADWYFHTQGLHAQRLALIARDEPEVQELVALIQELRRVEEQLLGASRGGADPLDQDNEPLRSSFEPGGPGVSPEDQAAAAARIAQAQERHRAQLVARSRELRASRDAMRQSLIAQGLLPADDAQRLRARALSPRLAAGQGLLLLARGADDQPLAVALFSDASGAQQSRAWLSDATSFPQTPIPDWRRAVRSADHWVNHGRVARGGVLRDSSGAAQHPQEPEFTEAQIGQGQQALQGWLQPLLEQMQALGVRELSLVASDDLHLLPWWRLLQGNGLRVRVWPTAGDWYRRVLAEPAAREPVRALPRWAQVRHDARHDEARAIPWVEMEAALSRRLWGDDGEQPVMSTDLLDRQSMRWPQAVPVVALLAAGHGSERRQDQASPAGLLIGTRSTGENIVLTGHELTQIRSVERLVLSACVLGRLDDALGEPLGAAATAFGYRARFAVGSLIRVGDVEAMVFSLALQWALKARLVESVAQGLPQPDWAEVFEQVQQSIEQGAYPAGFGAWLEQALPAVAQAEVVPTQEQVDRDPSMHPYRSLWREKLAEQLQEFGLNVPLAASWQRAWFALSHAWAAQPSPSLQRTANWMVCLGS